MACDAAGSTHSWPSSAYLPSHADIHRGRRLHHLPATLRRQRTLRQPSLPQQQSLHRQPQVPHVLLPLPSEHFEVLNRKFTPEETHTFNQRARALRSNIALQDRKWIYNPLIESEEEFARRKKLNLSAPWEDAKIREVIRNENKDKGDIVYGPKELGKLIDETGEKLGIVGSFTFGWKPRD